MPAPRLLPDNEVLVQLRRQGWTYADIAREYGTTESAVYLRLRQARATKARPTYKHLLPWTVKREHASAFPAQMLRLLGRMEKGEKLAPVKERMLNKWLADIREADVVVCYQPDQPPNPASPVTGGFFYSRRRPEDGQSLIREHSSAGATQGN